ncbi:MAG: DUF2069 domain-containing protein [Burkholderiaceae bacterium]|jgi:uncharacterized membrane protein
MRYLLRLALASLVGLIVLGIGTELWLAPLRPHGSLLVLKVVPLILAVFGVIRRPVYALQWSSMLVLPYLAEGLVDATAATGPRARYGVLEAALAFIFFASALGFLYPIKRQARAKRAAAAPSE